MRLTTGIITAFAAIVTTTSTTGCGSDLTVGPESGNPDARSAAAAVDSALDTGSGRIEIELFPGELVAREVHVEADDQEEKIVSSVTAIDPGQGTIILELGGLAVSYGSGTRFRIDDESHESRTVWEAAVQGELAAGRRPLIEARRNPAVSPQAPHDPAFTAADLRLENDGDEPKIEIYVDADNLESVSGTSLVVLRVLGLAIEVNGRTRLGPDDHVSSGQGMGD